MLLQRALKLPLGPAQLAVGGGLRGYEVICVPGAMCYVQQTGRRSSNWKCPSPSCYT